LDGDVPTFSDLDRGNPDAARSGQHEDPFAYTTLFSMEEDPSESGWGAVWGYADG